MPAINLQSRCSLLGHLCHFSTVQNLYPREFRSRGRSGLIRKVWDRKQKLTVYQVNYEAKNIPGERLYNLLRE